MKATFKCADCKQEKPVKAENPITTGYAVVGGKWVKGRPIGGRKVCYECCAERDRKYMAKHGRNTLYLSKKYVEVDGPLGHYAHPVSGIRMRALPEKDGRWFYWEISNWPGTLRFDCGVRKGRHNIARTRYDAWFLFGGFEWHGVQYGDDTQIIHCRRTKKAA